MTKRETSTHVMPREPNGSVDGVLYRNYDYKAYDSKEDADNDEEMGPGGGFFANMHHYDSIKDFRESKQKRKMQKRRTAFIQLLSFVKLAE